MLFICVITLIPLQLHAGVKKMVARGLIKKQIMWSKLFQKYAVTLTTGTLVGSATGVANSYLDRFTPYSFMPVSWIAWWYIRNEVVHNLHHDFKEDHVPHQERLMHYTAWATSWFAYLAYSSYSYGQPYVVREFKSRY